MVESIRVVGVKFTPKVNKRNVFNGTIYAYNVLPELWKQLRKGDIVLVHGVGGYSVGEIETTFATPEMYNIAYKGVAFVVQKWDYKNAEETINKVSHYRKLTEVAPPTAADIGNVARIREILDIDGPSSYTDHAYKEFLSKYQHRADLKVKADSQKRKRTQERIIKRLNAAEELESSLKPLPPSRMNRVIVDRLCAELEIPGPDQYTDRAYEEFISIHHDNPNLSNRKPENKTIQINFENTGKPTGPMKEYVEHMAKYLEKPLPKDFTFDAYAAFLDHNKPFYKKKVAFLKMLRAEMNGELNARSEFWDNIERWASDSEQIFKD